MAGIFEYIPIIVPILFGAGIVGAMVYERARTRQTTTSESST